MKKEILRSRFIAEYDYNRLHQIEEDLIDKLEEVRRLRKEREKILFKLQYKDEKEEVKVQER